MPVWNFLCCGISLPFGDPRITEYDEDGTPVCPNCGPDPSGDGTCRNCGGYALSGFYCESCESALDEDE